MISRKINQFIQANNINIVHVRSRAPAWMINLMSKNKIKTISAYEFWYPKKNSNKLEPDWDALYNFPIHAKRDKNLGLINNLLRKRKVL